MSIDVLGIESATAQLGLSDPAVDQVETIAPTVATTSLNTNVLDSKSLEIFRNLIADVGLGEHEMKDDMLKRWLLCREGNPIKAATMLKENLEWRKTNGIDSILEWVPPSHLIKDFPFQLCGSDDDGDLFGVLSWNKMDVDGAVKAIHEGRVHEEYLRYLYQCLEVVHRIYKETSTPDHTVFQGTIIIDLDGFSMYQFASRDVIEIVLEVVRRYEASYPNMLKNAIVVNTPTAFNVLWNIMKPFLSEITLSRVQIYGWVGQDWRSVLRKTVPVQQLPSCVGGANTTCKNYEASDGYVNLQPTTLPDFPRKFMVTSNVPAGQKLNVDVNVDAGTQLSWGFQSDYYDVGFSVLDPDQKEVVQNCRVDAHVIQQKGFISCSAAGKYTLVFDNSFSQYRSKTVYYTTKVSF